MGTTSNITPSSSIPWNVNHTDSTDWQVTWPEMRVKEVDPAQIVADLYLLEGLACHGFVVGYEKPEGKLVTSGPEILAIAKRLGLTQADIELREARIVEKFGSSNAHKMAAIGDQAAIAQRTLVENVVPTFWAYTHAACGGELRHHPSVGGSVLSNTRKTAWVQWRQVFETYGTDALQLMSKLFHELTGSIGGAKWAAASDLLVSYHVGELGPDDFSNKKIFLDRVLAMQHNGGCFLSKRTWLNTRYGRTEKLKEDAGSYAVAVKGITPNHQQMVPLLNCHASNPPSISGLVSCASHEVRTMVKDYLACTHDDSSITINGFYEASSHEKVAEIAPCWRTVNTEQAQIAATSGMQIGAPIIQGVEAVVQTPVVSTTAAMLASLKQDSLPNGSSPGKVIVTFEVHQIHNGSWTTDLAEPIVKTYKFKTWEEFKSKNFYSGHMVKTKFPKNKASVMNVKIDVQGVGNYSWHSVDAKINQGWGFSKLSGKGLLVKMLGQLQNN